MRSKLVLASQSPNRLALLESIHLKPDHVCPADVDETPFKGEKPETYVLRIAEVKAKKVAEQFPDAYIIAADTIAAVGAKVIGKADTGEDARKTLELLSGRRHLVYSGLTVMAPGGKTSTRRITTRVKFKPLGEKELQDYLDSNEWVGKSGCYGIQSHAGGFVEWINGSFSNVVGLPLVETLRMLDGLGFRR